MKNIKVIFKTRSNSGTKDFVDLRR